MTIFDILTTVFEFSLVAALVWGIFNEDRLVAFERKIFAHFRRKGFKVIRSRNDSAVRNAEF